MCGKQGEMFKADIEGAVLGVCKDCAKFGKVISRVRAPEKLKKSEKRKQQEEVSRPVEKLKKEIIQIIVDDYSEMIKRKREKLGLKQNELARKIAEKESIIQNIESGKFVPSIALARKFERFLRLTLIEQHEESNEEIVRTKRVALTIGDMLNLKK